MKAGFCTKIVAQHVVDFVKVLDVCRVGRF